MKKYISLVFILFIVAHSIAQVQGFSVDASVNSIVRTVDNGIVLVYTQPTSGPGSFSLYTVGSSTAQTFQVPDKWVVHDVRIQNGSEAYFCGTVGTRGLIGMFNVSSVFAGIGSVSYAICGWTSNLSVLPVDFKRLDLYKAGGTVNMAMTGTTLWYYWSAIPNTTVASAYLSNGNWMVCCYANKGPYMDHTDVACLDNLIVSTGILANGDSCRIKTFRKVQDFPSQPADPGKMTVINLSAMRGDVLAVHKTGDEVVLAQFHQDATGVNTVLFDVPLLYPGGYPSMTVIDRWYSTSAASTPYGAAWQQLELNYRDDRLWLLQKAEYAGTAVSGITDWLLQLPLTPTGMTAQMWNPFLCNAQSMDLDRILPAPYLSGERSGWLELYEPVWNIHSGNCYLYDEIWFDHDTKNWQRKIIDDGWDDERIPESIFIPSVVDVPVNNKCDKNKQMQ